MTAFLRLDHLSWTDITANSQCSSQLSECRISWSLGMQRPDGSSNQSSSLKPTSSFSGSHCISSVTEKVHMETMNNKDLEKVGFTATSKPWTKNVRKTIDSVWSKWERLTCLDLIPFVVLLVLVGVACGQGMMLPSSCQSEELDSSSMLLRSLTSWLLEATNKEHGGVPCILLSIKLCMVEMIMGIHGFTWWNLAPWNLFSNTILHGCCT